jgi:hypothetical protein
MISKKSNRTEGLGVQDGMSHNVSQDAGTPSSKLTAARVRAQDQAMAMGFA